MKCKSILIFQGYDFEKSLQLSTIEPLKEIPSDVKELC